MEKWKSKCKVWRRIVQCAFLVVTIAVPASATVLLPADFTEMVDGAQIIVHGRVTDVRAQESAGRRNIETLITMTVVEPLKGSPGASVVFRVPGGQVGRYRRFMVGAPMFVEGDEVVVFLSGRAPIVPMPFGLSQGVYRVKRDDRGAAVVTPPPVMARGIAAERVVRGDPARRPLPIDLFSREVRNAMGRTR